MKSVWEFSLSIHLSVHPSSIYHTYCMGWIFLNRIQLNSIWAIIARTGIYQLYNNWVVNDYIYFWVTPFFQTLLGLYKFINILQTSRKQFEYNSSYWCYLMYSVFVCIKRFLNKLDYCILSYYIYKIVANIRKEYFLPLIFCQ